MVLSERIPLPRPNRIFKSFKSSPNSFPKTHYLSCTLVVVSGWEISCHFIMQQRSMGSILGWDLFSIQVLLISAQWLSCNPADRPTNKQTNAHGWTNNLLCGGKKPLLCTLQLYDIVSLSCVFIPVYLIMTLVIKKQELLAKPDVTEVGAVAPWGGSRVLQDLLTHVLMRSYHISKSSLNGQP